MAKFHSSFDEYLFLYRLWKACQAQERIFEKINDVLRFAPASFNSLNLSLEGEPLWPSCRNV